MKKPIIYFFCIINFFTVQSWGQNFDLDGFRFSIIKSNTEVSIIRCIGLFDESRIVIPSSVSYNGKSYSVTQIGNNVFYEFTNLTSVTIPNTVTYIGNNVFGGCTALTSIVIPNSVTTFGNGVVKNCLT